jgi:DNA-binding protein YbaB
MSTSFTEQIEQAMTRLRAQQERVAEVTAELNASTASVTSKDRMVTVKVGPQGQLVSLTFHTTDYRTMAPAQLSAVLTDVLNQARADMGERVAATMRSFEGVGDALRVSMTGGTELDTLLAPLYAMRPKTADDKARTGRTKQEEFNG